MAVQSSTQKIDYQQLRLKVGLEVHQQLSTKEKLFCACPPFSEEDTNSESADSKQIQSKFPIQFTRILRATPSELGETDLAARFESRREMRVKYLSNSRTSCLVEADEEPPHPLNKDALDTSLIFSLALRSRVIDEIHVMRKVVVDGSNTSGFQRTAVVSLGGYLEYGGAKSRVEVQSISLEEDAARAIRPEDSRNQETDRMYILDRLGTPLVEVALAPIEGNPAAVKEAAGSLGRLIRSSGRTARGIGTIRQDLNISILDGAVIEVKGVQKLEQIPKVVQFEASRQKFFYDLATKIRSELGEELSIAVHDVTNLFRDASARPIKDAFLTHGLNSKICCILVKGYRGLFAMENEFHSRLGKELASIARTYGLGGIFHSDELPNYGISKEELDSLMSELFATERDGFVLLAGRDNVVDATTTAIVDRLRISLTGIPAETRAATPKGETIFLRPRPGAARMYPETDIPLIRITEAHLQGLRKLIPEPWDKLIMQFGTRFNLSLQLASQLFDSDKKDSFIKIRESTSLSSGFIAYSLVDVVQGLSREGVEVEQVSNEQFENALIALDKGKFGKEGFSKLITFLAKNPQMQVQDAIELINLEGISQEKLLEVVRETILKNAELVRTRGLTSQGAIMGEVMESVRGRVDGKIVSQVVLEELKRTLALK